MLAAIIHLGRALGLRVLAKGVQRQEHLTMLNSLGCDHYKGDLLSPAVDADAMFALLQSHTKNRPAPDAAGSKTPKKRGPAR